MRALIPVVVLLAAFAACDKVRDPVSTIVAPTPTNTTAMQPFGTPIPAANWYVVGFTVSDQRGNPIRDAFMTGVADEMPGISWTLYTDGGIGTARLRQGWWTWTVQGAGYQPQNVRMYVSSSSTSFAYALAVAP